MNASDSSVIVIFGHTVSKETSQQVSRSFYALGGLQDRRIRNLHPAYASLVVEFDPLLMIHDEAAALVERACAAASAQAMPEARTVDIPVCYDSEFGPDLTRVAEHTGMAIEDIITAHSSAEYFVCFLGFSPGFAYLGGLPTQLATPRLGTPRKVVAQGSVGIADGQTGVYPVDSPGGWQLIGRTPLQMFHGDAEEPTRLRMGDAVRFRRIERREFENLKAGAGALS